MMSLMVLVLKGYLIIGTREQGKNMTVLCRLEMYMEEQELVGKRGLSSGKEKSTPIRVHRNH